MSSVKVRGWSVCMCVGGVCRGTTGDMVRHFSLSLYLAGGTRTPTSGTTAGGNVDVGRLDGGKTAAIVVPIMIVALIIVVVIVIAVTVVVIYRLRRTGKFSSGPDMVPFSTFPDNTESIPEKMDTL